MRAGDPNVLTKIVSHPDDHEVFAYLRKNRYDQVLIILNFSPEIDFQVKGVHGVFRNVFGGNDVNFDIQRSCIFKCMGILAFEKLPMLSE